MVGRLVTVVPDSERVEARLAAEARSRGPFLDLRSVCTVTQLVERCEPARWLGLAPAPPLVLQLLVATLAPEHARAAFGSSALEPEFAPGALEVVSHLRAQSVTPARLREAALGATGSLAGRASALASLWEALDAALTRQGLVDPAQLTLAAARRLRAEGLPPRLSGERGFRVQGVSDLFPARLELFEALAQACHTAGLAFELRWPSSGEPRADLFVLDAVRQMEARWQELDVDVQPELSEGPLAWVGAAAFAEAPSARAAPGLTAFTAATPREEARQLAARVKALVSAGTPPERIAVAFRELGSDTEALLEALGDLGVPARARLGVPLLASPPGRLALSVLALAEDGVPADALAEALESGLLDCLPPGAARPRAAFQAAGVRDQAWGAQAGQGGYAVRLEALARRTRGREPQVALRLLASAVDRAVQAILGIPEQGPALELLEGWWDALSRLGLFRSLASRPEPALAPELGWSDALDRARATDQAAGEALASLLGGLKEGLRRTGLARAPLTRAAFARLVRQAARDLNLPLRGPRAGAVWLLDARELHGRDLDALFLGGLVDGRFPGRAPPLPLLAEDERLALNQLARQPLFRLAVVDGGARLPVRAAEDRLLLALALGSAPQVTLSRARADATGRPLLPSPFLDGLDRAVAGLAWVHAPREPVPRLAEVWSESDLRARTALELLCPGATRQTREEGEGAALLAALGAEPWLAQARALSGAEVERLGFFTDSVRPPGPFSGQLPGALLERLAPRLAFGPEAPLDATLLRAFGTCGFQGLARHLLGLQTPHLGGEEADERTAGSLLHEVLGELVPELQRRGWLGGAGPLPAERSALVDEVVAAAAVRLEARAPTGHPLLWQLGQERAGREVRRLLAEPAALRPFGDLRVEGAEVRFGSPKAAPELLVVCLPAALPGERDVHVKGSIDRLDVGPEAAGVVDYKRGSVPRRRAEEALLVTDFQLPLYLHAIRALVPGRRLEAAWVSVRGREALALQAVLGPETTVAELLATDLATRLRLQAEGRPNLATAVHALLERLRAGRFGPRPVDCGFCELQRVCRITTRRLAEAADGPAAAAGSA